MGRPIDWTHIDKHIMEGSALQVARRFRISRETVHLRRVELGLTRTYTSQNNKVDPYHAIVGRYPDNIVAEIIGCDDKTVRVYRHRHGIEQGPSAREIALQCAMEEVRNAY